MQKLELTWIGKGEEPAVEPRILLHDSSKIMEILPLKICSYMAITCLR